MQVFVKGTVLRVNSHNYSGESGKPPGDASIFSQFKIKGTVLRVNSHNYRVESGKPPGDASIFSQCVFVLRVSIVSK
jgi:hypothetical protein